MSITATEASAQRERDIEERTLHDRMAWFSEKYTESMDKRAAAEFQADLLMLVQAIHRDASRETHALLMRALSAMPSPAFLVKPE